MSRGQKTPCLELSESCQSVNFLNADTGWRSNWLGKPSQLYQGPHLP